MSEATNETNSNGAETIPPETIENPQGAAETGGATADTPSGEAPKRRRGRPPGSGKTGSAKSPEQIEAGADSGKPSKRAKAAQFDKQARELFAKQLLGVHTLAAQITGIGELQLAPPEGAALADAVCNTCEQYNLAIDGKTGAFLQLAATAAMIYAPRYMHFAARVRAQQANTVDVRAREVQPQGNAG